MWNLEGKDDKNLKKTASSTKKEKSAGKGGRGGKDDKKKKKSKTDLKAIGYELLGLTISKINRNLRINKNLTLPTEYVST